MEPMVAPGVDFVDGQAAFDADGDHLVVPTTGLSPEQGSIEAWVAATPGAQLVFGHTTRPEFGDRIQLGADGMRVFYRLGDSEPVVAQHTLVPGTWTHLVLTYEKGTAQLYVNGQPDVGSTYTGLTRLSDVAHVGNAGDDTPNEAWRGRIARVRLWPRALTAEDVTRAYGAGQTP
jgi:concanavalin A-like lectin/glucanase superfamily protein